MAMAAGLSGGHRIGENVRVRVKSTASDGVPDQARVMAAAVVSTAVAVKIGQRIVSRAPPPA
jgi:hypothetical protein